MKKPVSSTLILLISATILAESAVADAPVKNASARRQKVEQRTVFITGSLIPQRVEAGSIGTRTFSPVRIIDRREIDGTGRYTTSGVLIYEPSLRVIGR